MDLFVFESWHYCIWLLDFNYFLKWSASLNIFLMNRRDLLEMNKKHTSLVTRWRNCTIWPISPPTPRFCTLRQCIHVIFLLFILKFIIQSASYYYQVRASDFAYITWKKIYAFSSAKHCLLLFVAILDSNSVMWCLLWLGPIVGTPISPGHLST